jgi:hypothetical protein
MDFARVLIAAGATLVSGAAAADSPACAPLQSEYVALLRQAVPGPGNGRALAQQLAAAEADAEQGNCNRFLFFGPPKSPACPSIEATIARLQDQLAGSRGSGWASGPSPDDERASVRSALEENGCSIPSLQASASGPGRTLCVRTCDGYYFPVENRASSSRVKVDAAVCQAMYGKDGLATLYVQRGDDVADARSVDGKQRYGDQPFAFLYRDTFDAACHAELKDGLAALRSRTIAAGPQPAADRTPAALASDATAAEVTPVTAAGPATMTETVADASTRAAAEAPSATAAPAASGQAASIAAPPAASGQAALRAISTVQSPEAKPPVRFVGAPYYARIFSYSGE